MATTHQPRAALTIALLLAVLIGCTTGQAAATWTATFERPTPNETTITMHTTIEAQLLVQGLDRAAMLASGSWLRVRADNDKLLSVGQNISAADVGPDGRWHGSFPLEALFLGLTHVYVELMDAAGAPIERAATVLPIIIVREVRTIDHVFTGSVATLVSLLYINFGAALSLTKLKGIVRRPIGPAIGFFGQFLIMPLVSEQRGRRGRECLWMHASNTSENTLIQCAHS